MLLLWDGYTRQLEHLVASVDESFGAAYLEQIRSRENLSGLGIILHHRFEDEKNESRPERTHAVDESTGHFVRKPHY